MKQCRYLLIMLALLFCAGMKAQYNPSNPEEPGAKPWSLTLKAIPADAGSFNIGKITDHAAGEQINLQAYDNGNYKFANWEDEAGNVVATTARHGYTMPAKHVTLVARYAYSPTNPGEPESPSLHQYSRIYLQVSPTDGGSFNVSSGNSYEVGTVASLRAYSNSNFKFEKWTEKGQTISTESQLEYTVKASDSYLTAHFKYAPGNPGEPNEATISHHLYLKANPSEGGYFNVSSDNSFVTGQTVYLTAYSNSYYQFRNWTQDGEIVSTSASFSYVMPDKNTTLVANYDYVYSPNNPDEPGVSQTERYYIYGMRENVLAGQTINFPVYLENSELATGLSVDMAFPLGFTVNASNSSLTSRTNNHTLEVQDLGNNRFRFLIRGADNIQGVNGRVLEIPVSVPDTVSVDNVFTIELSKGAIFKPDGSQAIIPVRNGSMKIQRSPDDIPDSPDYIVLDIQSTEGSVMPQDVIHLSWQVKNQGNLVGYGGWSERIYLVSENGKKVSIGTVYYETNTLSPNEVISRDVDVPLAKLIGLEGAVKVSVTIIPSVGSGEITEYQANNSTETEDVPLQVGKLLYLTMPENTIVEGESGTVRCQLARSGNWTSSEKYQLSLLSGDDRIDVPQTVTIPREQSAANFYLTINDNHVSDADSVFTIQVSGNGYEAVVGTLVISDDEQPFLKVTSSKSEITEGETFQLTITAERAMTSAIPLTITAERPSRFVIPSNIVIPANETSVTVNVTAVDNDEIELQESIAIRVSSPDHEDSECIILLNDNDMPTLSFTLTPEAVCEDGGQLALLGVIKRSDNLDKRVTLKLSDNSNGLLSYGTTYVILDRNKPQVQFNIGVVDNDVVEGDRQVTVTAEVYVSSCDCSVQGNGAGSMTANVTIIDNDGPTLKITPKGTAILEGSTGNVFTISHNAPATKDVKVTVSSDRDDMLQYNHQLTIPAGSSSASLLVDVKNNDVSDDSNIVTFKVDADGYAMGTCWLLITDQTLPDAAIALRADKNTAEAESTVTLTVVVTNQGNIPLNSRTPVEVSFDGKKLDVEFEVGKSLQPGDSACIVHHFDLPAVIGTHTFEAIVNGSARVEELLYSNNTVKLPVKVLPSFSATAHADKSRYNQGDSVFISGTTIGSRGRNAQVEVYVINGGIRQALTATSDSEGRFSTVYKPLPTQVGSFKIGACFPGEGLNTETSSFEVVGLVPQKQFTTCEISLSDTYTGTILISNPCSLKQSGLQLTQKSESENCDFQFNMPKVVESGQKVEVEFTVKGNDVSKGRAWQQMPIEITSAEGASVSHTIYYYVNPLYAQLEVDKSNIETTMTVNAPREYPITIRNIGRTETGKITLVLPSWMETATSRELASLQQGDSVTVMLRFLPFEGMKLNIPVVGHLGINCENGNGTSVSFSITPVSEVNGTLTVDVIDEFTYYTEKAPHVNEATVRILDPSTMEVVVEGKTDYDGLFSAEIPEGYYAVSVEAEKHKSYEGHLLVNPGVKNGKEIFISYEAITYDFSVIETGIEDEYEVETIGKFEVNVPKPVVTISFPHKHPEPYSIIPVTITNHGLVHALDVSAWFDVSNGYHLEPLNDTWIDTLQAQQSYVIYTKLIPSQPAENKPKSIKASTYSGCYYMVANSRNKQPCAKYPDYDYSRDKYQVGRCSGGGYGGSSGYYGHGGSGPGWPSGGGGGGGHGSDYHSDQVNSDPSRFCDKGPHHVDDYGPIGRDTVPDGPVREGDCHDDEPILIYKLVPVKGTRYDMLGVAADGVSQVKITLDPRGSLIPPQDCDEYFDFKWVLSKEDLGSIESISNWEAVYTAPSHYPNEFGATTYLEAKLTYKKKSDGIFITHSSDPVKIEIARPPVVFIHGLGDNRTCWFEAEQHLRKSKLYKNHYNCRVDYEDTNTSTFNDNIGVVYDGIIEAQRRAISQGYMATKCDLVGHSMGGILARLFVERGGRKEDVNRIITVNTPHSGSELGDIVTKHKLLVGSLAKLFYKKWNIDAVRDLGVESDETSLLVNVPGHFDIPVYALGTDNIMMIPILLDGAIICEALSLICGVLAVADPDPITKALCVLLTAAMLEGDHLVNDDYAQIGAGDLVVSNESQRGGCTASEIIKDGAWHIASPKDHFTKNRLKELLTLPPSDPTFSTTWFAPPKRYFKHDPLAIIGDQALSLIPIVGDFQSILTGYQLNVEFIKRYSSQSNGVKGARAASQNEEGVICIDLNAPDGYTCPFVVVSLNGQPAFFAKAGHSEFVIPSTFSGEVKVLSFIKGDGDEIYYDEQLLNVDEPIAKLVEIETDELFMNAGDEKEMYLTCTWDDGSQTFALADHIELVDNGVATSTNGTVKGLSVGMTQATVSYAGLTCNTVIRVFPKGAAETQESQASGICNTVTLSFKQRNVMTRQAFRGTLTVNNGSTDTALRDLKVNLEVRDEEGRLATKREFQIDTESIEGFEGNLALDAGWTLAASATGTANILFIPTKYAAPTEPKDYSFGGSFSYTDPFTGLTVTRQLNPVTLTVNPSPNLDLTYFMQRDIYGDDAMTEEVEPMIPSEFALLINNRGYGDAENMNLTTSQPKIIDNQKGLAIKVEITSSQLNGGKENLSMGGSMASDFGTIPANSQAYAQWWLQSSLMGHFIEYDVKATHLTSRDNPYLSLVDTVSIHELIHGFMVRTDTEIPLRGFLVNDIADEEDLPDEVYFTDATHKSVSKVGNASFTKQSDTEYLLFVKPSAIGWNYGSLADPTNGKQRLVGITRLSDNVTMAVDNVWQTTCTLRDGKDPVYEKRVHFVFDLEEKGETYLLSFEPRPDTELKVERFKGGPEENALLEEPLKDISVLFNKPIDATTFTYDDVTLTCQGVRLDASKIGISSVGNTEYKLDLEQLTNQNGYYVLTVHTDGITDNEGFTGSEGKQYSWIQIVDGTGIEDITASGKLSISVSPLPVGEKMFVHGNFERIQKLTIHDMNGIQMLRLQGVSPNEAINTSALPPSVYLLTIQTDKGTYKLKFVKI